MTLAYTTLPPRRWSRLAFAALILAAANPLFFLAAHQTLRDRSGEAALLLLAASLTLPAALAAYLALIAFLRLRFDHRLRGLPLVLLAAALSLLWPSLVTAHYFLPH